MRRSCSRWPKAARPRCAFTVGILPPISLGSLSRCAAGDRSRHVQELGRRRRPPADGRQGRLARRRSDLLIDLARRKRHRPQRDHRVVPRRERRHGQRPRRLGPRCQDGLLRRKGRGRPPRAEETREQASSEAQEDVPGSSPGIRSAARVKTVHDHRRCAGPEERLGGVFRRTLVVRGDGGRQKDRGQRADASIRRLIAARIDPAGARERKNSLPASSFPRRSQSAGESGLSWPKRPRSARHWQDPSPSWRRAKQ